MKLIQFSWRCGLASIILIVSSAVYSAASGTQRSIDKPIRINMRSVSLAEILGSLCKDYKLNVLSDGIPIREKADVVFSGTLGEGLEFVCKAFGYRWEQSDGVMLLKKTFTDRLDIPQMNAQEWRQVALDELKLIPTAQADSHHEIWPQMVRKLSSTLSEAQVRELRSGGRVTFANLDQHQRQMFLQTLATRVYGPACAAFAEIAALLDGVEYATIESISSGLAVKGGKMTKHSMIGLVLRDRAARIKDSIPLGQIDEEVQQ